MPWRHEAYKYKLILQYVHVSWCHCEITLFLPPRKSRRVAGREWTLGGMIFIMIPVLGGRGWIGSFSLFIVTSYCIALLRRNTRIHTVFIIIIAIHPSFCLPFRLSYAPSNIYAPCTYSVTVCALKYAPCAFSMRLKLCALRLQCTP